MKAGWLDQSLDIVAGTLLVLAVSQSSAEAARAKHVQNTAQYTAATHYNSNRSAGSYLTRTYATHSRRSSSQGSGLQCVPFARENSGIELSGNAGTWWNSATGLYERGTRPEVGSVLNFRATSNLRMGHVAVVTNVISSRHIEIDHANWSRGRVSRNVDVVDVSTDNDWTAVRVALSQAEDYGSIYPTYGFIYDRPDRGTMVANNAAIPAPMLNAAPSDLRVARERISIPTAATLPEEVAEAPDDPPAPRSSGYRRHAHSGKPTSSRTAVAKNHRRGYSPFPTATTFRVSTRNGSGVAVSKPHKPARRHF